MHLDPTIISIASFVGVFGMIGAGYFLIRDRSSNSLENRLDVLSGKKSAKAEASNSVTKEALLAEGLSGLAGMVHSIAERFANMKLLFEQADTSLKAEQF